jgi:rsbT co-antagonist protein RsbR
MADLMHTYKEKLLGRWCDTAVAGAEGRGSADDVHRELDDLYDMVVRAMTDADAPAAGQLKAALAELSRSRARRGFTPSDTAREIFLLRDAVYELVADSADMVTEFLAFSRLVDDLGLRTFEAYVATRQRIIADQAEAMLELSALMARLRQGIVSVPLADTLEWP